MLDYAMELIKEGYYILPVHGVVNGKCTCKKPDCDRQGKHPLNRNGSHGASNDSEIIKSWWKQWPYANIAAATGKESGLLILDIDPKNKGFESLKKLEQHNGALESNRIVETGSGGLHYHFCYPTDYNIGNKQNFAGYSGLDIRGNGGYAVMPPSNHISGEKYKWKRKD